MIKGYSTASSDMIRGYNRILLHGIEGSGQLDIDEKMVGGGGVEGERKIDSHREESTNHDSHIPRTTDNLLIVKLKTSHSTLKSG